VFNQSKPMCKYGPTVCDGVNPELISFLHRRRMPAAQNDIEAKA
jgi:hypothetical protein